MKPVSNLFKRSKRAQFENLIRPHLDPLYRVAYRYTQNAPDAEDLVQDFILSLFQKQIKLEEIQEIRPWLMRGLYNKFVDGFRQKKRDPLNQAEEIELRPNPETNAGPAADLSLEQLQQQLMGVLQLVNEDQRILLMMHDVEGYTLAELTEILDTPIGTLKSRLHRGRAQLRRLLAREPFGPELRVM